jgi:hypothetical protein
LFTPFLACGKLLANMPVLKAVSFVLANSGPIANLGVDGGLIGQTFGKV